MKKPSLEDFKQWAKTSGKIFINLIIKPAETFSFLKSNDEIFGPAIIAYALYLCAYGVFYAFKPLDFPAETANLGVETLSMSSWIYTEIIWGTLFTLSWIFFISVFGPLSKKHGMSVFFLLCVSVIATEAVLAAIFYSWPGHHAGFSFLLASALCGIWLITKDPDFPYIKITALMLLISSISALMIPIQCINIIMRWERGYMLTQFVWALWMIWLSAKGLKYFTGTSTARSVMSLIFALFANFALLFLLFQLGFLSRETLNIFFIS